MPNSGLYESALLSSVVGRLSTFSNIFSSETTGPTEVILNLEPPWDGLEV